METRNREKAVLIVWIAVFILLILFALAYGAIGAEPTKTMAFNQHFTVLAPSNAKEILDAATRFKEEIEDEWGIDNDPGPATISWKPSGEDTAFTWAKSGARKYHTVYLKTGLNRATGSTLKHEVAHVVAAGRLPLWANEGLASMYDDKERKLVRESEPNIRPLRIMSLVSVDSVEEYANCERLALAIVRLRGKKRFIKFASDCVSSGTEESLMKHYSMTFSDLNKLYLEGRK
jgi:hypothetical protein